MKKIVNIAIVIFWLSLSIVIFNSKEGLGWLFFIIIVSGIIIEWGSSPNPKLVKDRIYRLRAIVAHGDDKYSVVLSYDKEVETYKCRGINCNVEPVTDKQYRIEIENGKMYLTSAW